jgi:hypothetical protein
MTKLVQYCTLLDSSPDEVSKMSFFEANRLYLRRMVKTAFGLEFTQFVEGVQSYWLSLIVADPNPDSLRMKLNIHDDLSKEEKDSLRKQTKFCSK